MGIFGNNKGDRGLPGVDGATGPKGDKGDQGLPGADGADGAVGPKGDKGDQGDRGLPGVDGATGPKGDKGDQGLPGADGADGVDGAVGPKGDKGDQGDHGLPGADGVDGAVGPKGDKGDQGDPGPADWGALPKTNAIQNFIQTLTQIFRGRPAIQIESSIPEVGFFSSGGTKVWFHVNNANGGRGHILMNENGSPGWVNPHPLYFERPNHRFIIWGHQAWTSENLNPSEYWRKDELPAFSKRWVTGAGANVPFLRVNFANSNGVAAYAFDILIWGGSLNNYSNLYRYSFHALIEDQQVQFVHSNMQEQIATSFSNNSVTLTFGLWGGRNNLIVKGELLWGHNWTSHAVL